MSWGNAIVGALLIGSGITIGYFGIFWIADLRDWLKRDK
jgi:hypothetical protein